MGRDRLIERQPPDAGNRVRVFMASYYVMILAQVFHGNQYSASIRFIMPQIALAAFFSIFCGERRVGDLKTYLPNLLIVALMAYSTLTSSVVTWGADAYALVVFHLLYLLMTWADISAAQMRRALRFLAILALLLCAWLLVNAILSNDVAHGRVSVTVFGTRRDENYLAAFLTPGFAYLLYSCLFGRGRRFLLLLAALFVFSTALLTGSRAAFLAMLLSALVICYRRVFAAGMSVSKKASALILSLLAVLIGYLFLRNNGAFSSPPEAQDDSEQAYSGNEGTPARMMDMASYTDNIRLEIWGHAMQGFYEHPWIGSGIQSGAHYARQSLRWDTHSCYVDILAGQGLVGAFLYLLIYIGCLKVKRGNRHFMMVMMLAFFLPLFFINGYESASFWGPMTLCKAVSDQCRTKPCAEILWS